MLLLFLGLVLSGCEPKPPPSAKEVLAPSGYFAVSRGVYDNHQNTAFILQDWPYEGFNTTFDELLISWIVEVTEKKRGWERQFPDKKIIAISTITSYNKPSALLIYYEQRE